MMKTLIIFQLLMILAALVIAYGWVINLVALFHSSFTELTGILVLRVAGIFIFPIGGILGYF